MSYQDAPFAYAAYSHYYSPWFRRGPAMQDWQGPAPFPTVTVPFAPGDPYDHYPYVRRYPLLDAVAVPAYARDKDQTITRMGSSNVPASYAHMVPQHRHIHRSEGGVTVSLFDDFDDDDDLDDIEDVLAIRFGEAEAKKKLRPFKAVSELFKKLPSGRTRAEELVHSAKRLERQLQQPLLVAPPPPRRIAMTPVQTGLVVGGVALAALGVGMLLGQSRSRRR